MMGCFSYAFEHKPEGVSYVYNEPFLENDKRRQKVIEVLEQINTNKYTPGLIDTLGSQMHINIHQDFDEIRRCFEAFKKLQERGIKIQITEFDMTLGTDDVQRIFGEGSDATLEQAYEAKLANIAEISRIINESGVTLSGVSYWSLTDGIDFNLERMRSELHKTNPEADLKSIPTACGGLIPTHKKLSKTKVLEQEVLSEEELKELNQSQGYTRVRALNNNGKLSLIYIICGIVFIILLIIFITYKILK